MLQKEWFKGFWPLGKQLIPRQICGWNPVGQEATTSIHATQKTFPPARRKVQQPGRQEQFKEGWQVKVARFIHRGQHRNPADALRATDEGGAKGHPRGTIPF